MRVPQAEPILVVDDEEAAARLLVRILEQNGYTCSTASDAAEALRHLERELPALVVTDLDMPGRSGLDLIKDITRDHPGIATLMVTGKGDRTIAKSVLETGAYGYMTKPLDPDEVTIQVYNALIRRTLEEEARRSKDKLEDMVRSRTSELWQNSLELEQTLAQLRTSQEETIQRLALVAELRDDETAEHTERMSRFCALLAERSGADRERAELIRLASLMHDIGKIGVPDGVMRKPGPLAPEEHEVVRQHAEYGYAILKNSSSELLRMAADIALTHHEHWDGTGYPRGLKGEEIPFEGRVAAIADVFDALTSDRVYRKAYPLTDAVEIMRQERGKHFDPVLLDLFLSDLHGALRVIQETGSGREVMV